VRTLRSTYRGRESSTPMWVTGVAVLALVAVAGFALYWWMFAYRVNRTAEIRRGSFNFQETAREQVVDLGADLASIDVQLADPTLSDAQSVAIAAQRRAIADQLCDIASDIQGGTSIVVADIIERECS